jgi:UDP-N-acetylglucosamine 3-dehydrogenase
MISIGVVGCGTMAQRHLNAYMQMEGVRVKAVCDVDFDLAKSVGLKYNATPYSDYIELLESEDVDAVDVCVPTEYHHEVILAGLDRGKHIFCEKPLTHRLEYAELIREKVVETGMVLMTGYLYNFHPSFKLLRSILRENIIGNPYYAIFRIGGRGGKKLWKHRKGVGGALLEMMVHMLDLANSCFGPFDEVDTLYCNTVLTRRFVEDRVVEVDAEDCVYVRLRSNGGVEIICEADLITPSYMNYVEVHGDNGSFFGSILDYFPTIIYCNEPRGVYDKGRNIIRYPMVDLVYEELRYFIDILRGVVEPINFIDKEIYILGILEKIRKDIDDGCLM